MGGDACQFVEPFIYGTALASAVVFNSLITTVPSGYVFTFDEQAGEEKLFLVFSRQPEPSLENLIYDLGTKSSPNSPTKASPVKDSPSLSNGPKVLLAMANVDIRDDVVGNLRRAYARRLH